MRGLIIREPHVSRILTGAKKWEMRSKTCSLRETVGLIRKGSGLVVGVATIVDCRQPIASVEEFARTEIFHQITADEQLKAFSLGWRIPWVLAGVRVLPIPIPYEHALGAVTWVRLSKDASERIEAQLS